MHPTVNDIRERCGDIGGRGALRVEPCNVGLWIKELRREDNDVFAITENLRGK
jgi:hypothetical protein